MRRILGLAVGLVPVLGLGMYAAVATPPKDATGDDIGRAVMVTGGPVEVQTDKETTVHKVTVGAGGRSGWHRHYDGGVFMVM